MTYATDQIRVKLIQEYKDLSKHSFPTLENIDTVVVLSAEEIKIEGENGERVINGIKLSSKSHLPLIFLGTKFHNLKIKRYSKGIKTTIQLIIPSNRSQGSTRTQIKDLSEFLKKNTSFKKILILSHSYHIPRIRRYCKRYLLKNIEYFFWLIGDIKKQNKQIKNEIEKIIKYSDKGDLPLF